MNVRAIQKGLANPGMAAGYLRERLIAAGTGRAGGTGAGIDVVAADWDNLIVLDACRYDVFERVCDLPGTLSRVTSRGSTTTEFLQRNFDDRQALDTVYVTANALVGDVRHLLDVYKLIGVWGDNELGATTDGDTDTQTHPRSVPDPEPVVERTLAAQESHPGKRLVAHFLPPHTPFLVLDGERLPRGSPYRTFDAARRGEVDASTIRSIYVENVAYVLDHVADLVADLDGKTVVTADHGELLGEGVPTYVELLHGRWPFSEREKFDYGHYSGVRKPELVHVPWLEIEADERRSVTAADRSVGVDIDESVIDEQLEALGYK